MSTDFAHEIVMQRQMINDMNLLPGAGQLGWLHPCGIDPSTREPLSLRMMFDRYAQCIMVFQEVEGRK